MIQQISIQLVAMWRSTSWIEILAVILALLYLMLAIRQDIACWTAALLSSCLYVWVFARAHLYMDAGLNVFYAIMAIYGHWQWRRGANHARVSISRWPWELHVAAVTLVVAASLITSQLLKAYTVAAWPFIDSMVTWSSVVATFLVARKVYENWHWWLVIDAVALYVYFSRHLYPTMILFALYVAMVMIGMREWRRELPILKSVVHA